MSKRKKRLIRSKQKIVIEATHTGFCGHFKKIPVYSTGESIGALLINLKESLDNYLAIPDKVPTKEEEITT